MELHAVLLLPGLLDEVGPGTVRLLHGGADPAVPHAHWGFWEVMAELVESAGQEEVDLGDSVGDAGWPA